LERVRISGTAPTSTATANVPRFRIKEHCSSVCDNAIADNLTDPPLAGRSALAIIVFSFPEYTVACCGDEGGRTLRSLAAFAEASAAHRSLGEGWGEGG